MPLFTVITVCYQAEECIEKTIRSVLEQTFTDYEYLVIDGLSTDGTAALAASYTAAFEEKGISYVVTSERDRGIYHAMNKGIERAKGQWMVFLNASDTFYDSRVLRQVSAAVQTDAGVICGATYMEKDGMYKIERPAPQNKLPDIMPACHQSIFWESGLLKKYKYDERYRICADRECLTRYQRDGIGFFDIDTIVSVYTWDGVSSHEIKKMAEEIWRIRRTLFRTGPADCLKGQCAVINGLLLEGFRAMVPRGALRRINRTRLRLRGWTDTNDLE